MALKILSYDKIGQQKNQLPAFLMSNRFLKAQLRQQ